MQYFVHLGLKLCITNCLMHSNYQQVSFLAYADTGWKICSQKVKKGKTIFWFCFLIAHSTLLLVLQTCLIVLIFISNVFYVLQKKTKIIIWQYQSFLGTGKVSLYPTPIALNNGQDGVFFVCNFNIQYIPLKMLHVRMKLINIIKLK